MRPGKPKYFARKVEYDGHVFDSNKEKLRYQWLKERERKGEIEDLQLQVRFNLLPVQREPDTVGSRGGVHKGKVIERGVDYVADFTYIEDGELVVEDVKGYRDSTAYAVFALKRKLMLWVNHIRVKEI